MTAFQCGVTATKVQVILARSPAAAENRLHWSFHLSSWNIITTSFTYERLTDKFFLSAYANSDGTKDIPKTLSFCIVRGVKCLKPFLQMLRSREHSCHSFYWHTISFFTNMHFHSFPALSASAYIYDLSYLIIWSATKCKPDELLREWVQFKIVLIHTVCPDSDLFNAEL